MAFENIKNIKSVNPKEGNYYLLDTNIWVYAINSILLPQNPDKGNSLYTQFFFNLIDCEAKPRPRIILGSLLMSEIVNTYLKKYAMPEYLFLTYDKKGEKRPPNFDYKAHYRPTDHFKTNYRLILNEIKAYNEVIHLVDDSFNEFKPFQFGKNCPADMDFNDYYYFLMACKLSKTHNQFSFVTNDGDFHVNNFEILTANKALLDLKLK